MRRTLGAAVLVTGLAWASAAGAQPALDTAIALYEKAAFADALAALEAARPSLSGDAAVVGLRYRVLCLLALDRPAEARAGVVALVEGRPAFRLDDDAAPRLRQLVDEARRTVLPGAIRTAYEAARADWDARRVEQAGRGFAYVSELGELLKQAGQVDRATMDLLMVADGFARLAAAEIAAAATPPASGAVPPTAAAPEAVSAPATATEPATATPSPAVATPSPAVASPGAARPAPTVAEIYDADDADVTPPAALDTAIAWRRGTPRPPAGTRLGDIEVIVDERGRVIGAQMVNSVSAFYDAIVVESARRWRYRPATRAGQPVLYRRVMVIRAE